MSFIEWGIRIGAIQMLDGDDNPLPAVFETPFVVRAREDWQDEADAIRCARARQGQGEVVAIDGVPL